MMLREGLNDREMETLIGTCDIVKWLSIIPSTWAESREYFPVQDCSGDGVLMYFQGLAFRDIEYLETFNPHITSAPTKLDISALSSSLLGLF